MIFLYVYVAQFDRFTVEFIVSIIYSINEW